MQVCDRLAVAMQVVFGWEMRWDEIVLSLVYGTGRVYFLFCSSTLKVG